MVHRGLLPGQKGDTAFYYKIVKTSNVGSPSRQHPMESNAHSVLQCVAVCCSVFCNVCCNVCCSVLQCVGSNSMGDACRRPFRNIYISLHPQIETFLRSLRPSPTAVLQRVAACCSVLQRIAAYCRVLQRIAVCCSVLQRVAVRCSVSFTFHHTQKSKWF